MERINEEYLADIRNTLRVIVAKSENKKQQLFSALIRNIRQSEENQQTKQQAVNKVIHIQRNLDNSGSIEDLLLDYHPSDYPD